MLAELPSLCWGISIYNLAWAALRPGAEQEDVGQRAKVRTREMGEWVERKEAPGREAPGSVVPRHVQHGHRGAGKVWAGDAAPSPRQPPTSVAKKPLGRCLPRDARPPGAGLSLALMVCWAAARISSSLSEGDAERWDTMKVDAGTGPHCVWPGEAGMQQGGRPGHRPGHLTESHLIHSPLLLHAGHRRRLLLVLCGQRIWM